eukprot:TRINITY_DN12013_c0_g3_i1.p2 TRINITY_DN12013_c0_g3~~TRINITY_DN12013_c0_g3_i1.p2  ORF type:complete len:133 (-),score=4.39 TRINITY_DN12013_c0_g3_i1:1315-1713(-)
MLRCDVIAYRHFNCLSHYQRDRFRARYAWKVEQSIRDEDDISTERLGDITLQGFRSFDVIQQLRFAKGVCWTQEMGDLGVLRCLLQGKLDKALVRRVNNDILDGQSIVNERRFARCDRITKLGASTSQIKSL